MNSTLETIAKRYSCRWFTDEEPTDDELKAIAEAAIQAPSGMNRQNWQIIIVKNKELINAMDNAGMKVLASMQDLSTYERIMSRGGKLFYNAPCMAVIAIKEAHPKGAELIDLGIVAQNMSLAATSLGLANLHCGLAVFAFVGNQANYFKERLKFPKDYECGMAVLLGHSKSPSLPHNPNAEKITFID